MPQDKKRALRGITKLLTLKERVRKRPQLSPESRSRPSGHNNALICPGGPRRSCHRSFGACASLSRISAICLLAAASSQWRHIVQIRCRRRSEWCGSDCRIAFCLAGWGYIASDRTPHLIGWLLAPVSAVRLAQNRGIRES